jgi:hypothetical protein
MFVALFSLLPLSHPSVLEVGPGTGQATRDLLKHGAAVHAIEIGPATARRVLRRCRDPDPPGVRRAQHDGGGNQVAVSFVIEYDTPPGGHLRDEEIHLWTFDADGKVSGLRHYTDTAKHIAAWKL